MFESNLICVRAYTYSVKSLNETFTPCHGLTGDMRKEKVCMDLAREKESCGPPSAREEVYQLRKRIEVVWNPCELVRDVSVQDLQS